VKKSGPVIVVYHAVHIPRHIYIHTFISPVIEIKRHPTRLVRQSDSIVGHTVPAAVFGWRPYIEVIGTECLSHFLAQEQRTAEGYRTGDDYL
jgi:hypothetical protein